MKSHFVASNMKRGNIKAINVKKERIVCDMGIVNYYFIILSFDDD